MATKNITTEEIVSTLRRLRDAIGNGTTGMVLSAAIDRLSKPIPAQPKIVAAQPKTPKPTKVVEPKPAPDYRNAALKAWVTRRARAAEKTRMEAEIDIQQRRSVAANKAWATRRARAAETLAL